MWHSSEGRSAVQTASSSQHNVLDPASILDGRSPGERAAGALFQTKPAQNLMDASNLPTVPQENLMEPSPLPDVPRAFSAIVPPEDAPVVGSEAGPLGVPTPIPVGAVSRGPISPFVAPPVPPLIGPVLLTPADAAPPTGTNPIGSIPAAPEPASWATMLTGFLGVGTLLRRARRPAYPPLA